jgi:membrane protease subunit HflK
MIKFLGWGGRTGLFTDDKGPWGPSSTTPGGDTPSGNGSGGNQGAGQSGGPWGDTSPGRRTGGFRSANVSALDDFLRRSRARFGGGDGGGGLPGRPNRTFVSWGILAVLFLWFVSTSIHSIAPGQSGVVTQFGRYSRTLGPGVSWTLPAPIERVRKVDVQKIQSFDLGSASTDDLMLTGDQNLINLAYQVRWNIRSPELYLFQMAKPEETIQEVAESAMRAVISDVTLNDAMGDRRAEIELQVAEKMQQILDSYRSGIQVQGIAIKQADPPEQVNDSFKQVTAAQQDAQTYINNANAYALQLRQKAQGEATAFDKVYAQYKLAPEVTRRRMYYEQMEGILSKVNKTIVETPGVTPYLPLPAIKQQEQQQEDRQP